MVDAQKPLVTLTGITGYLGAWTCLKFLEDGGFRVRGTVRDKTNEAKLAPIREAFGAHFENLELVEADLENEQSLMDAVAGSTYMVHMASPFFFAGGPEKIITPAVNGTISAMRACKAAGVRRVVITSSCAALQFPLEEDKPADRTYDETMWTNPERPGLNDYFKSKFLAEKAAWDFQAALPEAEKFEVSTICPAFIMGPPLRKEDSTSTGFMKRMLLGQTEKLSGEHCCLVDVRDVADAHLLAIKNDAAANRRFILSMGSPSFQDFFTCVSVKYSGLGWPITTTNADANPDEYISLFNNEASKSIGVVYTALEKTAMDMADKMVELGSVVKPE